MNGFVGNLSKKQEEALSRFKEMIRDVWRKEFNDDYYLLRWLRARGFDTKKSEKMLRAHLEWRKEFGADTILEDYKAKEVIEKYYPGGFCGIDLIGRPLWVDPTGHCDIKGLIKSATKRDLLLSRVYLMEHIYKNLLPKASAESGMRIEQTVVIFDLEHFGKRHLWKPGLDFFIEVTRMCEANYPETMGQCFVVNAPSFFPAVYQLVKPFLHEATQRKIQVLGSNYKSILPRYFHPSNLPARYGGEKRDPDGDPRCRTEVSFGGDVPTDYYLTCDRSVMLEKNIARGASHKVEQIVEEPDSRLRWEFCTDEHDVAFGVFRKCGKGSKDWEALIDMRRVSCHLTPESGGIDCDSPGLYMIRFDNSFSWTRPKRIWYRLFVEEPSTFPSTNGSHKRTPSVESFHSAQSDLSQ